MSRRQGKRRIVEGHNSVQHAEAVLLDMLPDTMSSDPRTQAIQLVRQAAAAYAAEADPDRKIMTALSIQARYDAVQRVLCELDDEIKRAREGQPAGGYSMRFESGQSDAKWLEEADRAYMFLFDLALAAHSERHDEDRKREKPNADVNFHALCRRLLRAYSLAAGIPVERIEIKQYASEKPTPKDQLPTPMVFLVRLASAITGRKKSVRSVEHASKIAKQQIAGREWEQADIF